MNAQVDFNVPHVFLCVTACLRRSFHMIHIPATLTKILLSALVRNSLGHSCQGQGCLE